MKTIALLTLLLGACVDFDHGSVSLPVGDGGEATEPAGVHAPSDDPVIPAVCSGANCYDLIAFNAYFPAARPNNGGSWHTDGSLPVPMLDVLINGVLVGSSMPNTGPLLYYAFPPPNDFYRVTWNESVATTLIYANDALRLVVRDATDGSVMGGCHVAVIQLFLDNGNLGCTEDLGQIEVHFIPAVMP